MKRTTWSYITAAVIDALNGMVILALPYIALLLAAGKSGTLANTLSAFAYLFFCLLFSGLKIKYRHRLVTGLLVYAAGCLLVVLDKSIFSLFCAAVIFSIGNSLFFPTLQSWFTEGMNEKQVVSSVGGYSLSWIAGYLVGPVIAGYMLSLGSYGLEYKINLIFAVSAGVAFIVALSFMPDFYKKITGPAGSAPAGPSPEQPGTDFEFFIYIIWTASFLAFFLNSLIRFVFTEVGKSENLSAFTIGSINSAMNLSMIAVVLLMRRFSSFIFKMKSVILFELSALAALLFFVFMHNSAFYFAGAILIGANTGYAFLASASCSLMMGDRKNRFININEAIVGAGSFISGLVGYAFAQWVSTKYSFAPGFLVALAVLAVQAAIYFRKSRGESSS